MKNFKQTELTAIVIWVLLFIVTTTVLVIAYTSKPSEAPVVAESAPETSPTPIEATSTDLVTVPEVSQASTTDLNTPNPEPVDKPAPEPARVESKKPAQVNTPVTQPKTEPTPVVVEKPKEVIPPKSSSSVNSSAMLKAHNGVRLSHGLSPLSWSNSLAQSAQGWSDKLKTESCKMRHDYNSPYGENIYWESLSGGGTDQMISTDSDPVYWWAAEEESYNYAKNTCQAGEQCGHYTQLVWADTTEVGCGVSSCIKGEERIDLWVCRYNPPGNVEGMQPY